MEPVTLTGRDSKNEDKNQKNNLKINEQNSPFCSEFASKLSQRFKDPGAIACCKLAIFLTTSFDRKLSF